MQDYGPKTSLGIEPTGGAFGRERQSPVLTSDRMQAERGKKPKQIP